MPLIRIDSLDDPRLAPYRNMKEADLRARDGRFIAEGKHVVRRLLASRYATESLLCVESVAGEFESMVGERTPIYAASRALLNEVVGFKFHQGCLAVGQTPAISDLDALLVALDDRPATLVVAHELNNTENLGTILRISAAFGAAGLILGPRTADPFFRQSVRVSMGTIFSLALAQSSDLIADLAKLKAAGFETFATVTDTDAEPLQSIRPHARQAIVLGSEGHGLDRATVDACTRRATIPMHLGTDSLNVSIASAVFLYHLTQRG